MIIYIRNQYLNTGKFQNHIMLPNHIFANFELFAKRVLYFTGCFLINLFHSDQVNRDIFPIGYTIYILPHYVNEIFNSISTHMFFFSFCTLSVCLSVRLTHMSLSVFSVSVRLSVSVSVCLCLCLVSVCLFLTLAHLRMHGHRDGAVLKTKAGS